MIMSQSNLTEIEYVKPADIEKRSFAIIGQELQKMNITLDPKQEKITKRVIHTSADFEYATTLTYSDGAVDTALGLLRGGADIVTDTNMAKAGISRRALEKLGGKVHCFMADPDVAAEAKARGITRAAVSMERASRIGKPVIIACGNAPTALISLHDMIREGVWRPDFVIGVPVGFVNVVAAKELIMTDGVPYIVNRGRKGGSNVAAAICNALMYMLTEPEAHG
jgi:precorrin-8X/cobalt-precorrin-8 methylmutase